MSFSGTKGYLTKPNPGVMINPLHPLSKGLVGYWLFNEGTGSKVYDISGHGNHGTLKNMAPNVQNSGWTGNKFGGGLKFDGSNDYVLISRNSLIDVVSNSKITLSAWIYPLSDGEGDSGRIFGKSVFSTTDGYFFCVNAESSGEVEIYGRVYHATTNAQTNGTSKLAINQWHHVAMVYNELNDNKVKLYVNGVLDAGAQQAGSGAIGDDSDRDLHIGEAVDLNRAFDGSIDEVRIYNRALSIAEIKILYHNPFCNLSHVPIRRYYVPIVGVSPTGVFYGPLVGPFGGPI